MNLKDLKNNETLVAIYINDLAQAEMLQETFFSISKQTQPIDLLVYHNLEGDDIKTLEGFITAPEIITIKEVEGKKVEEKITSDKKINFLLTFEPKKDGTFAHLFNNVFNEAVENDYKTFSIVERNDIVGLNWYSNAKTYLTELPETDMLFPIIRSTVNGAFSNNSNEAPWAEGMAEEAGKVDLNLLTRFNCMLPAGAVFRVEGIKEESEEIDGRFYPMKESMKLSHYYEFLMRMVYLDLTVISIPRIGYETRVSTSGSFNHYSCKIPQNLVQIPLENGGLVPEEAQFWMDLAKKELFFDEDRKELFTPKKV